MPENLYTVLIENFTLEPETVGETGNNFLGNMITADICVQRAKAAITGVAGLCAEVPPRATCGELLSVCAQVIASLAESRFLKYGNEMKQALDDLVYAALLADEETAEEVVDILDELDYIEGMSKDLEELIHYRSRGGDLKDYSNMLKNLFYEDIEEVVSYKEAESYILENHISIIDVPDREEQVKFLNSILEDAVREQLRSGIPWQVTLAQAAIETGWSEKIPKDEYTERNSNNFFGIKYNGDPSDPQELFVRSWTQETINESEKNAWEQEHSRWALEGEEMIIVERIDENQIVIKLIQPFKVFPTLNDSIVDHSAVLENERYEEANQYKDNPYKYIEAIAGIYATDGNYYEKASPIIDKYMYWDGKEENRK